MTSSKDEHRRRMTADEQATLIRANRPDLGTILTLALLTGLRLDEIRDLRWGDHRLRPYVDRLNLS